MAEGDSRTPQTELRAGPWSLHVSKHGEKAGRFHRVGLFWGEPLSPRHQVQTVISRFSLFVVAVFIRSRRALNAPALSPSSRGHSIRFL